MTRTQSEIWNGPVGDSWARHAATYDRILEPLGAAALDRLQLVPGQRVVDIGCGTGATTVEIARRVAPGGSVLGVDVSQPMIAAARDRLPDSGIASVELAVLDVEHDNLPGPFDAAFSRLGVMFFERPGEAFAGIAAALRPGGRLALVCFQGPQANPFIMVPTAAALAHLDAPPMPPPGAPGPFSLADPEAVRRLLEAAGLETVEVSPGPDEATLGPAGELGEIARQAVEQNPAVMAALGRSTPEARQAAVEAAADALSHHVRDGQVVLGAGTWVVAAEAPTTA